MSRKNDSVVGAAATKPVQWKEPERVIAVLRVLVVVSITVVVAFGTPINRTYLPLAVIGLGFAYTYATYVLIADLRGAAPAAPGCGRSPRRGGVGDGGGRDRCSSEPPGRGSAFGDRRDRGTPGDAACHCRRNMCGCTLCRGYTRHPAARCGDGVPHRDGIVVVRLPNYVCHIDRHPAEPPRS